MDRNTIYCGDSIATLKSWPEGGVDLAFADPPYNIGYVYDKYEDDKPDHEFEEWCRQWMTGIYRVLKPTGSFYLAIGDDFAAQLRLIGRDIGFTLRNWIIWHYTFGQNARTKFGRAHTHILYFVKDAKKFTFNDRNLRYPSARHTEYQDLRADPLGRVPDDVWNEFPRVCGTFKEREGFHGCQLPEALLTRIILASSNRGDLVLDPFMGSGTTAAVAKKLGRDFVGIDLSPEYVKHSTDRVAQIDPANPPLDAEGWPELHAEMLATLYRETKVTLSNLLPNVVALRVIAAALGERTGTAYTAEQVTQKLSAMRATLRLPKLPNDTEFVARKHVKDEGKTYERKIFRVRQRRTKNVAPETSATNESREAMRDAS